MAIAIFAYDHSERASSVPLDVHEKRGLPVSELINTLVHSGLAKADFVSIVLLFSHILAEFLGYPLIGITLARPPQRSKILAFSPSFWYSF